ncbi:MAG TPA: stage V sporulation protein D [Bacillota bacterium]|nr:stage V sporulation protein D [Bacillota bacterium]
MLNISTRTVKMRIITTFFFSIIIFFIIIIRLAYVQFVIGKGLTDDAVDLWTRELIFEADRGLILDRNEEPLTENISSPSVLVIPRQIEDVENTSKKIADILNMSLEKAKSYVTQNASIVRIHPEGRKINKEQEKAIRELNVKGIYLVKDSKRHYPYGNYLSHVLGFTGIDNQGLMGLELAHDDRLKGKKGNISYFSDAKGGRIEHLADNYTPPENGLHLKTTIDINVQTIIERELDLAEHKYNPDGSMAIAINPNTGAVLGMSSRPNFDPENYQDYDSEIFDRNLPVWSTFEPGSTFKIITLAAALEEKQVDLEKDTFFDKGSIKVGGANLRCWRSGGHGSQTYMEVVENSCNPGFVNLGLNLGEDVLFSYIEKFGFGKKTGIDLEGEGTGILFSPEQVGPVELGTTSFGQGVSVTPIQQVMAVAAAINGGDLYEPYIADAWIDPVTDKVIKQVKPKKKHTVISKETSEELRKALERVVANGTGRPAYVDGYRVGGKTGTAQKVGDDGRYMQGNYILSFIGFAPANDPEIVVFVAIDNPKDTVQFGGVVAAPIVGTIIEDSLSALNIERSDQGLEKKYMWPEMPKVKVPDLIGQTKEDLTEYMTNLSIKSYGEGDQIIDQSPRPGTSVEQGSTIRVYFAKKNR